MKEIKVKDLMKPLDEYTMIHQDSLVIEAIIALEKVQLKCNTLHYLHRAMLVYDDDKKVVGKLSQWDVVRGLEPKYNHFGENRFTGLTPSLSDSMIESLGLWQEDLNTLCQRVADKKVRDYMYTISAGEKISEDAYLGKAMHIFVVSNHKSILVSSKANCQNVVGVLRLVDVFKIVAERIKNCEI